MEKKQQLDQKVEQLINKFEEKKNEFVLFHRVQTFNEGLEDGNFDSISSDVESDESHLKSLHELKQAVENYLIKYHELITLSQENDNIHQEFMNLSQSDQETLVSTAQENYERCHCKLILINFKYLQSV
jgi:hypothetical protein